MTIMPSTTLPDYFRELTHRQGTAGPIGELTVYLADGNLDSVVFHKISEKYGLKSEPWFKGQTLDLVIGYAQHCLDSGERLANSQIADLRALRTFLSIKDGEFLAVRPAEVATILRQQLELILEDMVVDTHEDLYQVELQSIFGLGYDDYLRMTRIVLERVWQDLHVDFNNSSRSQLIVAKMAALEPLVRIAVAGSRSLGALYN